MSEEHAGFLVKPQFVGNGNLFTGISSLCSLPCFKVTVSVGQALKTRRWLSCGVMLLLHRPPVRGMSPNNQPHSVVVSVAAILSSLFEESGKASSLRKSQLHGQHVPSSRNETGLQGLSTLKVPGSAGVLVQTITIHFRSSLSPFPGLILQISYLSSFFTRKIAAASHQRRAQTPCVPIEPLSFKPSPSKQLPRDSQCDC